MSVKKKDIQKLLTQAKSTLKTSSYKEAKDLFLHAQRLLDSLETKKATNKIALQAAIENGFSEIAYNTGDQVNAQKRAEMALELSRKSENKMVEVEALQNLGNVYGSLSDYNKAWEIYREALVLNEEIDNKTGIAANFNSIAIINWYLSDYPQALAYYQKALSINKEIGNKAGIAANLGNIGVIYHELADYPRTLEYYQKALTAQEEVGNKEGIAANLGNIGIIYHDLLDYPKALEYYQKAKTIDEAIGNKNGLANNLGNIGEISAKMLDYPKALEFIQKALAIYEELGNKTGIGANLNNIGEVYFNLANYPKALEFHQKALSINEEIGNKAGISANLNDMGEVLLKLSPPDYKNSEKFLKKALALNRLLGIRKQEADCLKNLSELYLMQERWQEVAEQYKAYHETSTLIFNLEAKKQADNFAIQRKIQEQEKQQAVEHAAKEARHQATKSLLQHVLPHQIVERILDGDKQIADYHPSTSILFADIKGFTSLTTDIPPFLLLQMLHSIFTRFDKVVKEAGCTKIKTIGDGYMMVSGAPEQCDDHAERIVQAAKEMIKPIELPPEVVAFLPKGATLKMRIGIHLGPIIAGVVGQDAFTYDIYSDAVNVASRMESTGAADRIHVSADFMRHLLSRFAMTNNHDHGITFESRGEIDVKGKGKMKTFFLMSS